MNFNGQKHNHKTIFQFCCIMKTDYLSQKKNKNTKSIFFLEDWDDKAKIFIKYAVKQGISN